MGMSTHRIVAAAIVGLLSIAGCRSTERSGTAAGEVTPVNEAVSLVVVNNNYADVDVYAVRSTGSRVRIGTVNGNNKGTFNVDRSLFPTGDLALVAEPIGAFGRARSGRVIVAPGDEVEFRIMPVIDQSTVFVRPKP
jgi:outer membrane murein-binding lipoprotein Lpp